MNGLLPIRMLTLAGVLFAAACLPASADPWPGGSRAVRPEAALQAGTEALERGDYLAADSAYLGAAMCSGTAAGREALLMLASLALDPRNPRRSATAAVGYAGLYLRLPDTPPHSRALASSLALLGLELGADLAAAVPLASAGVLPLDLNGSGGDAQPGGAAAGGRPLRPCPTVDADALLDLPVLNLDTQSVSERIRQLEAQRSDLTQRLRASETSREALEVRLAEITAELERIRRVLRQ